MWLVGWVAYHSDHAFGLSVRGLDVGGAGYVDGVLVVHLVCLRWKRKGKEGGKGLFSDEVGSGNEKDGKLISTLAVEGK